MNRTCKKSLIVALALTLTACGQERVVVGYPPVPDLVAATEAKPKPSPDILTDPAAADRYNAALEAWGDRVRAAGVRLCVFFRDSGMNVACSGSAALRK